MTNQNRSSRREFITHTLAASAASIALPWGVACQAAMASKQSAWQIGIYTRPWSKFDYRTAFDAIAKAGFRYCGLMTTTCKDKKGNSRRLVIDTTVSTEECHVIAKELRDRNLQVPSVYGGGIPVQKSLQAGIEGLRKLIDNCAVVGCKSLLMGGTNDKLFDVYYKAVTACCDYALEKGMNITVKPHGGKNANGAECRRICKVVGHRNFGVWYDPGNIYFYSNGELNPVDDAPSVDGLVKGMCIKDFQMNPKRDVMLTPGTGMVDFPKVMAKLHQGGFRSGALVIECVAPGDGTLKTLHTEAVKARQFVEKLVSKTS